MRSVAAGQTLAGMPDIGLLLVTTRDNRPVYVRDVASVVIGPSPQEHRVWMDDARRGRRLAPGPGGQRRLRQARRRQCGRRGASSCWRGSQASKGRLIPADVDVTVTRDYGETANEKANELLFHLALATVSIVVLIAFAIGWREALVTLVVIPTTILLTLFAAKLMGYTINRVSLFALIFSIGILVDDAIVVVENIARHWAMKDGRTRRKAAIEAVAEVGNPTIVATLTVVAALLPMLFVSGLMGPYMAPIPANASAAMLFSFFVAMVDRALADAAPGIRHGEPRCTAHGRARRRPARPPLSALRRAGRALASGSAWRFLLSVGVATRAGVRAVRDQERHRQAAAVRQQVGARRSWSTCPRARRWRTPSARCLRSPTVRAAAAGDPLDPDLRRHAGAVQFQRPRAPLLSARMRRARRAAAQSRAARRAHPRQPRDRARSARSGLKPVALAGRHRRAKVVEVPPGPPVLATLLAEIYGPDPRHPPRRRARS